MARDAFGYGTPKIPFDRTIKNREGQPLKGLYPNYYDESGEYIGLDETPSAGTGLDKNLVGMPEAWKYSPTKNALDTDNIDFNNMDQVKAIQSAIGADVDGQWGPQTERLYRAAINERRGNMGLDQYSYDNNQSEDSYDNNQFEAQQDSNPFLRNIEDEKMKLEEYNKNFRILMPGDDGYPDYNQNSLFKMGSNNSPYKIYQ